MNNKVFGIFICILLMTSYITLAGNNEKTSTVSMLNNLSDESFDTDLPVWEENDYWIYKVDTLSVDFEQGGQYIHVLLETDELKLEVLEVNTETYTVKIDATLNGNGQLFMNSKNGPINMTLNLTNTKLTGTIIFNKSDLGIKELNPKLDGRLSIDITEQHFVDFKIPKISFRATIDIFSDIATPLTFIDFPLDVNSTWGVPGTNISIDGTIRSPWLRVFNFVNNLLRLNWNLTFRILEKLNITVDQEMIINVSDILHDVLPIINISHVLNDYLNISNCFEIQEIPSIFLCNNTENITVQGKTYNAYNISVIEGIGSIYYAEEAGNIIKISGLFKDIIPFISNLNIELKETNYQR